MRYFTFFLFFLPFVSNAQSAVFQKISISDETSNLVDTPITYPIVVLPNTTAANKINQTIKERIFWYDDSDKVKPAVTLLRRDREDRHLYTYYEILFNSNGILCFDMEMEATGINTNNWTEYFNFDLNTGKELLLKDMIQPSKYESFKAEVFRRKKDSLQQYLVDFKKSVKDGDVSKDLYDESLERVKEYGCMDSVSLQNFHITKDYIQVDDECKFPHLMMAEEPYYELKFELHLLKDILKPEILNKLLMK